MTPADLALVIRSAVHASITALEGDTGLIPETIVVERPRNPEHGDYATNIALQLAKKLGTNPREFATDLAHRLSSEDTISEAEIAGPGFINIRLNTNAQGEIIAQCVQAGDAYGRGDALTGVNINLEFVSANPTGPIHLGGTRWAAVGDSLGRILNAAGANVTREYYFNDHGEQIDRFARSLIAAADGQDTPEDGYAGDYISEIATTITDSNPQHAERDQPGRHELFRKVGVDMMFAHIKRTLAEFGTEFDVFFHENSLFESGAVDTAIQQLKDNGNLYEHDGAWWLRTSNYGDDKDRVVIKSDGNAAYIAGDIAYIADKRARGFDICLYMLGADHHGYIARLKAAAQCLGHDPQCVEVLIGQMVNLVRDGQPVRMSKRAGTVITLDDLVEAIGVDAARYAMVRSSVDSTLDIDLQLWASKTNDNPVYYVQYAHARLCSLLRNAADAGITCENVDYSLLEHEREGDLMRTIGEFPRVLATAAELREPHRVARYMEELAATYHRFYDSCRVLPMAEQEAGQLHSTRLQLCLAAKQTLANGLAVLGISAPERM